MSSLVHVTLSITDGSPGNLPPLAPHWIKYHQQDNHGIKKMHCGAASAQMVLKSVGSDLLDQHVLFVSAKAFSALDPLPDWHTAPDGLTNILNNHRPPAFNDRFYVWALDSEEAISRKICWAIYRGVAPIALVDNNDHWLVVVGFTASRVPNNSMDIGYTIESFDVFDPWPPTTGANPPPHGDGTDKCGTGSATGENRGDETNTIKYEGSGNWRTHRMRKVKKGNLSGKYVAICDGDPPADLQDTPPQGGGAFVSDPDEIKRRATDGLDAPAQAERIPLRTGREGTHVEDPLLVEREDLDPPEFYYIVPFVRDDGVVPVLVAVDAYEQGTWSGFVASPDGTHFNSALRSPGEVIQRVGEVEVDGLKVPLRAEDLHGNADGFHADLVWRPCAESLSPYWPFYRFDAHLPDDSPITIYVRIDGEVFTELH